MCRGRATCGNSVTLGRGKIGMTGGMAAIVLARRAPCGSARGRPRAEALTADDLDGQVAVARPVELGGDDGLELAEHELALGHREGEGVAEQGRLQVRMRVTPVAIGVLGIVVLPFVLG